MNLSLITIDPDFRDYFPPLEPDAYEALKDKILHEGFTDPIKLWSVGYYNYLLDGHHRYQICQELGIEPRHVFIKCSDKKAALEWIRENQRARRNTTTYRIIEQYLSDREAIAEQAKLNQQKALKRGNQFPVVQNFGQREESKGKTDAQIAKMADSNPETVRQVRYIKKSGYTDIIEKVESGKMSIYAGYKESKRRDAEKLKQEGSNLIASGNTVKPKKAKQDKPNSIEFTGIKSEEQQLMDDAMEGTSLESIVDDLSKQNDQLLRKLEVASANDAVAENLKQQDIIFGLEQRINMLTQETYEKDKQLKWQNRILRELVKLLGIDKYAEIIGEVRKLAEERNKLRRMLDEVCKAMGVESHSELIGAIWKSKGL